MRAFSSGSGFNPLRESIAVMQEAPVAAASCRQVPGSSPSSREVRNAAMLVSPQPVPETISKNKFDQKLGNYSEYYEILD